jgi:hypothetical protein
VTGTVDTLAAALDHAARGWHVFPVWAPLDGACRCPLGDRCARAAKHPRTKSGFKDATADAARITAWWSRQPHDNIGVWTGASGLVVLDIDGPDAHRTYGELLVSLGAPGPPWCTDGAAVATGRDGGMHLYFAAPPDVTLTTASPWADRGIDIRAGGSYVLAPGSLHASGRRYRWLVPIPGVGLPELAAPWVAALVKPTAEEVPPRPVQAPPVLDGVHATRYGRAALVGLLDDLSRTGEGARNTATYAAMRRVLDLYRGGHLPSPGAALDEVAALAALLGLPAHEVHTIRASARRGAAMTEGADHAR